MRSSFSRVNRFSKIALSCVLGHVAASPIFSNAFLRARVDRLTHLELRCICFLLFEICMATQQTCVLAANVDWTAPREGLVDLSHSNPDWTLSFA